MEFRDLYWNCEYRFGGRYRRVGKMGGWFFVHDDEVIGVANVTERGVIARLSLDGLYTGEFSSNACQASPELTALHAFIHAYDRALGACLDAREVERASRAAEERSRAFYQQWRAELMKKTKGTPLVLELDERDADRALLAAYRAVGIRDGVMLLEHKTANPERIGRTTFIEDEVAFFARAMQERPLMLKTTRVPPKSTSPSSDVKFYADQAPPLLLADGQYIRPLVKKKEQKHGSRRGRI